MDKKTIIGLVLICLVFLLFGLWNRPNEEQRKAMQRQQDSIAKAQKLSSQKQMAQDSTVKADTENLQKELEKAQGNDSLTAYLNKKVSDKYSSFSSSALMKEKKIMMENDVFKVILDNKGGVINQVELKNYKTYSKKPITFFTKDGNRYALNLTLGQVVVSTLDLYFVPFVNGKIYKGDKPIKVSGNDSVVVSMRLFTNKPDTLSAISDEYYWQNNARYIEYKYILRGNDYRLGYNIVVNNMQQIITDDSQIEMNWKCSLKLKEKDSKIERQNSSIYYKLDDEVDNLKEMGRDDEKTETGIPVKWISYKQQFFSAVLIANNKNSWFESANMKTTTSNDADTDYMRTMSSRMTLAYDKNKAYTEYNMDFYFGANKYNVVKKYNIGLERTIPLGWGFFLLQWLNRFVIIPVFDFLMQFGLNFGLIILLLTLLVKLVLFPLAYKSFSSTAKMRVIQPEINKLNEKYPKQDQAMQKQQATMQLYKRAGINPMAGCLPMLLQFPVLIAMYRFFPSSVELRGQSFLWADDLSTYDSIVNFSFNIPFYGNHVSLFCLLMTVAQLLYTKMTMNQQSQNNAMPGMKFMMYGMPIFMMFLLNNFSAALNYYYLLSLLISVLQMVVIRKTINEKKILERLEKNSKKPMKQSKWQQRMEALEKQNRKIMEERQRKAKRK